MIDPKIHEIICQTIEGYIADGDEVTVANAIIGALVSNGFTIAQVDADIVRRVMAETHKES